MKESIYNRMDEFIDNPSGSNYKNLIHTLLVYQSEVYKEQEKVHKENRLYSFRENRLYNFQ